jgi:glycerophosphoryl diester phosphodiesterase
MCAVKIVAHRGVTDGAPENTVQAFNKAIELGADGVELDVRLTKDHVPVVYHYYYLDELTSLTGPIFEYSFDELRHARFNSASASAEDHYKIPMLREVIEAIGGRVELEIEIKGPEPEAPEIIGQLLGQYRRLWDSLEVTSFDPQLLVAIQEICPGIAADLLYPRSEPWMGLDIVAYSAIHRARLAGARAVHLNPAQLSEDVVNRVRGAGFKIHAWDVNDARALELVLQYQIPVICTDRVAFAKAFYAQIDS